MQKLTAAGALSDEFAALALRRMEQEGLAFTEVVKPMVCDQTVAQRVASGHITVSQALDLLQDSHHNQFTPYQSSISKVVSLAAAANAQATAGETGKAE